MGRTSNKQNKFSGGGASGPTEPEERGMKHSGHYEQEQVRLLLEQKPRMSWEEYKEKHKDQLQDKMGMGVEREQAEYRRQLDEERAAKLARGTNKEGGKKSKKDKKDKKDKKERKRDKKEKKRLFHPAHAQLYCCETSSLSSAPDLDQNAGSKKEAKKAKKRDGVDEQGEAGKKRSRDDSSSSSSESDSDSDVDKKKKKKKSSHRDRSDSDSDSSEGPVRLSAFHKGHYDD